LGKYEKICAFKSVLPENAKIDCPIELL